VAADRRPSRLGPDALTARDQADCANPASWPETGYARRRKLGLAEI
jgi:hypothetical protein